MGRMIEWSCFISACLAATSPHEPTLLRSEASPASQRPSKSAGKAFEANSYSELAAGFASKPAALVSRQDRNRVGSNLKIHNCEVDADCQFDGCDFGVKCRSGNCFTMHVGKYKCQASPGSKPHSFAKVAGIEDTDSTTWCLDGTVYKMCLPRTCTDLDLPIGASLTPVESAAASEPQFRTCQEGYSLYKERFCSHHLIGKFYCRKTCSRCTTEHACFMMAKLSGCDTTSFTGPAGKWVLIPEVKTLVDCADQAVEYTKQCDETEWQVFARWSKDPAKCANDEANIVGREQCLCGMEALLTDAAGEKLNCAMSRCKFDCPVCAFQQEPFCTFAKREKIGYGAQTEREMIAMVLDEGDRLSNPGGPEDGKAPNAQKAVEKPLDVKEDNASIGTLSDKCNFDGCCGCAGLCNRCWKSTPRWWTEKKKMYAKLAR